MILWVQQNDLWSYQLYSNFSEDDGRVLVRHDPSDRLPLHLWYYHLSEANCWQVFVFQTQGNLRWTCFINNWGHHADHFLALLDISTNPYASKDFPRSADLWLSWCLPNEPRNPRQNSRNQGIGIRCKTKRLRSWNVIGLQHHYLDMTSEKPIGTSRRRLWICSRSSFIPMKVEVNNRNRETGCK